jgi:hypothetical protein
MNAKLAHHLLHNLPLAIIAMGLPLYVLFVLVKGVFYTNQGKIYRNQTPAEYWSWVFGFTILSILCLAVLAMSYLLPPSCAR